MNNLKINNPCPFVPKRMNKHGDNYFCKSCCKTIVDFRGKTDYEIKSCIDENTCGIFTSDQLPAQQQMTSIRRAIFFGLAILSIFGFTIRPLSAQTKPTTRNVKNTAKVDSIAKGKSIEQNNSANPKAKIKKAEPENPQKGLIRKKKARITTGCPSF